MDQVPNWRNRRSGVTPPAAETLQAEAQRVAEQVKQAAGSKALREQENASVTERMTDRVEAPKRVAGKQKREKARKKKKGESWLLVDHGEGEPAWDLVDDAEEARKKSKDEETLDSLDVDWDEEGGLE